MGGTLVPIDKKRTEESSAKLDVLLAQLEAVLEEGHKALIFSQFVSLFTILRGFLDRRKITYEYLDGRTRRRKERIEAERGGAGTSRRHLILKFEKPPESTLRIRRPKIRPRTPRGYLVTPFLFNS